MNIIRFDIQIFQGREYGGICTYFHELKKFIQRIPDSKWKIEQDGILYINKELEIDRKFSYNYSFLKIRRIANIINSRFQAINNHDLTHSTYYRSEFIEQAHGRAHVITIHDMIPEDFPNYFMDFNPSLSKRRYYLECDAVICVSQYTKKRLIANYGEGAAPIFVVHHASRFQLTQAEISSRIIVKSKPPIIKLLFVGSRVGYKRFDLILRAISQILDQIPSVELTCVGGGAFTKSEREMMTQLSILIRQVNCNDSELRELYLKSDLYLCASETEGFGLPTLEAMAMGCPALVSDIEVFEEICGDTVWKFQSGNANDLSKKMKQLILDSKLRDSLAEKALLRSKKYTWEKTAEETVAVYKAALNSVRVLKK